MRMGGSPREEAATEVGDGQLRRPIYIITSFRRDILGILLPPDLLLVVSVVVGIAPFVRLIFFRIRLDIARFERRSSHASHSSS
jgi:hypothetical protein